MEKNKNYLIDMDGVLISGALVIPGAAQFVKRLNESQGKYARWAPSSGSPAGR